MLATIGPRCFQQARDTWHSAIFLQTLRGEIERIERRHRTVNVHLITGDKTNIFSDSDRFERGLDSTTDGKDDGN